MKNLISLFYRKEEMQENQWLNIVQTVMFLLRILKKKNGTITISQDLETYKEYLDYLKQLNQQRLYLKQQIALIHQVGQALSYKIFKSKKAAH